MERIKQAIEKAKTQATAGVSFDAATVVNQETKSQVLNGQIEVNYLYTDVVSLDSAHLEKNRIVAFNKNHHANWAFDVLRTKVLQKMDEHGWRTLAITSPTLESGKTVVAINLAISIAHQTQRTAMLADFDLRHPMVSNYLGLKRQVSFNDVLSGKAELPQALVNPGLPRLVLLPTARPVPKSSEVLSSRRVAGIIEELRDRYQDRIVIFDLPPMLAADDVLAVLPRIDCVLMVVGSGMSNQKEIEEAMRHLGGANLLGVALNKGEALVRKAYY